MPEVILVPLVRAPRREIEIVRESDINRCLLLGVKRTSAVHFAGLGHQSGSACYFFFIMIVIRHKTTAAARWALLLIASVPLPMTPSPLQSGQVLVFTCASLWTHSQA